LGLSITEQIAREIALLPWQVQATIGLLDDGNTVPFIARYRKESTGGLDEVQLRQVGERLEYLRKLEERKESVRSEIASQDKLTPELDALLLTATSLQQVEDLYRPYRPKRHTRAALARDRGLDPLAQAIRVGAQQRGNTSGRGVQSPAELAASFVCDQVPDVEAALAGARDIIAEQACDEPAVRQDARRRFAAGGVLVSQRAAEGADPEGRYRVYYDFRVPLRSVQPHQWLALQRGEKDGSLKVRIEAPDGAIIADMIARFVLLPGTEAAAQVRLALEDGYERLLRPSVEREIQGELSDYAGEHAIHVFATNLRNLLLQPPLRERRVMGIDPGYRTGCKVATVDETGKLLHIATIYPHPPQNGREKALKDLAELTELDQINTIAIGNGTASRETEALAAELVRTAAHGNGHAAHLAYVMVSEAGASVYSASDLARAEFPDLDVSIRGAVSIARRLQDPLAELVKIDPKSIGVGLYQHDVDQKRLAASLDAVVESVVNYVGVDANTASAALLAYVAGISKKLAQAIVDYRDEHGPFQSRSELKQVRGLGPKAFEQAAGFLRIPDGRNPLDNTVIHPESYNTTEALLDLAGLNLRMKDLPNRLKAFRDEQDITEVAQVLGVGALTLADIVDALVRPGLDPREDLPAPVLRQDVLSLEHLQEGMVLTGTVRNVVDFGAFVDIGVKHDGLVHVSKMAKKYVSNPHEIVGVGDVVNVKVVSVDRDRGRVELSLVL
jgi:protein Tex